MERSSINTEDIKAETIYADVLLPVPIPKLFTYKIPGHLLEQTSIGHRVIVQFGRKILTGLVWHIHSKVPEVYKARYLFDTIDEEAVVTEEQRRLFQWMAEYYMCTLGEVMNAGVPTGLKLSSESKIQLHPEFNPEESELAFSDKELELIKSLEFGKSLTYPQAAKTLNINNIYHVLKSLINKQAVIIYEEIREQYKPKKEKRVRIINDYLEEEGKLEDLFNELEKQPKQLDVLLRYLQLVNVYEDPSANEKGIARNELIQQGLSASSYNTLKKNGVLEEFEVNVPRFVLPQKRQEGIVLSEIQQEAGKNITDQWIEKEALLLHGITGSGKTEIYVELIREQLDQGNQVLYLLPEIALTTQIVERLLRVFGDNMGVYHSKYSDNERVEVWKGLLSGRFQFIVGVRSAVFLPFDNLGLIIIDEEQETSFKQHEPAPRYHARDVALYLGKIHRAKTLLGSATPSLESFFQARSGKYGYVGLEKRYGEAILPEIKLVNMRQERKNKSLKSNFSSVLLNELEAVLGENKQALLFQNRRGYSPFIICDDCGWIPECQQCAVSLTYHMYSDDLRCHYCGYKSNIPATCAACGSTRIRTVGFGTEKIEDDLKIYLPDARIKRMDLDTTRSRYSYQQIIQGFDTGSTDILIGTQMITKGLDFSRVTLVGVMDADRMLNFPDFRSTEKSFQMITQVSGRAGRRKDRGLVIIQTSTPEHALFEYILRNDYNGMASTELSERKKYNYPPYTRIIEVIAKHKDKDKSSQIAHVFAHEIGEGIGRQRMLGPEQPLIAKIRNEFLNHILIKIERDKINLGYIKKLLTDTRTAVLSKKDFKGGKIVFNVDPV